jgi:hypothetical protein
MRSLGQAPVRAQAREPGHQAQVQVWWWARAGGRSAAASLGELGSTSRPLLQDSPRRATDRARAAQRGQDYPTTADSIRRSSTTRSRAATSAPRGDVWRLAQVSNEIIDQVRRQASLRPRYAGYRQNRSSAAPRGRALSTGGETGPELLLGATRALPADQLGQGQAFPARDAGPGGRAVRGKGIRPRLVTAEICCHVADAVVLARAATPTSSTCRPTQRAAGHAIGRPTRRGLFANPVHARSTTSIPQGARPVQET